MAAFSPQGPNKHDRFFSNHCSCWKRIFRNINHAPASYFFTSCSLPLASCFLPLPNSREHKAFWRISWTSLIVGCVFVTGVCLLSLIIATKPRLKFRELITPRTPPKRPASSRRRIGLIPCLWSVSMIWSLTNDLDANSTVTAKLKSTALPLTLFHGSPLRRQQGGWSESKRMSRLFDFLLKPQLSRSWDLSILTSDLTSSIRAWQFLPAHEHDRWWPGKTSSCLPTIQHNGCCLDLNITNHHKNTSIFVYIWVPQELWHQIQREPFGGGAVIPK